jgi:hypothetical protein
MSFPVAAARVIRLVAYVLVGVGIALVLMSVATAEPVNRSGFVPGVLGGSSR